jgi:hypothetical protein
MIMNELNNDIVFYMSILMIALTAGVGLVFAFAKKFKF